MDVSNLIKQAEACHKECALEYFNAGAGLQDTLDMASIMSRYPELYSRETYDVVANLDEGQVADGRERRFLKSMFTGNFVSNQLKELNDQLMNAEGDATVKLGEEEIPYRAASIVMANEGDYTKRGQWDGAYINALAKLNPLRAEIDQKATAIVTDLGYTSMIDAVEKLENMRVYPMRDLLAKFLLDTKDAYENELAYWTEQTPGLSRDTMRHADIGHLLRAGRFDDLFPPDGMVPMLARSLSGLGIDLDNQKNITLDLESRPKKSPRAFCIGINTPHDVRLIVTPRGGADDYGTLFHEAGHLQFGAHMEAEIPYMYKHHGDTSVHESYAFLLQHLTEDPVWWHEIMKADPGEFLRFARFHRLYFLRRYGAKLQYEVEYAEQGGGAKMASSYAEWLERGTGVPYPTERYLDDFDSGFYVLQYLQAWIWEVQLREHLKKEFGEAWFLNHKAGDFLRGLWSEGMKYDVWETAERLGYDGLDIAPLQAEIAG